MDEVKFSIIMNYISHTSHMLKDLKLNYQIYSNNNLGYYTIQLISLIWSFNFIKFYFKGIDFQAELKIICKS